METLTLTELGARIAARWRLLLVAALLGAGLGVVANAALPTRYEATTVVHVDADDPAHVDMAAEEAVAMSRRVTAEALDVLGDKDDGLTIRTVEESSRALAVEDSRLLRITFAGPDARAATRGADAVAQAYLAARSVDAARGTGRPLVEGTVVDPARVPRSPVGPGLLVSAIGAMVLALLAATPVAARPRRRADVTRTPAAHAS